MGSVTDLETAQIGKLFHAIDVSGSGELEYTEFIAAMLAAHGQSDGTVRQTFSFLDSDGDGRITLSTSPYLIAQLRSHVKVLPSALLGPKSCLKVTFSMN